MSGSAIHFVLELSATLTGLVVGLLGLLLMRRTLGEKPLYIVVFGAFVVLVDSLHAALAVSGLPTNLSTFIPLAHFHCATA